MRSRALAVAGVAALALALAGCDVSGTVDVGADATTVDLAFLTRSGPNCLVAPAPLVFERVGTTDDGALICHLTGTVPDDAEDARARFFLDRYTLDHDGTLIVTLPPSAFSGGGTESLTGIDVTVGFPGPVRLAGEAAPPAGRVVHLTDAAAVRTQGVTLVADRNAAWTPVLTWTVGGLAAGIAAGLLAGARRRRGRTS